MPPSCIRSTLFRTTALIALGPAAAALALLAARDGFSWVWGLALLLIVSFGIALAYWWSRRILTLSREIAAIAEQIEIDVAAQDADRQMPGINLFTGQTDLDAVARQVVLAGRAAFDRVTDLERRQHELEQDSTLLAGVLATMQESVVVVDAAQTLRYVNVAARVLFDIPSKDSLNRYAWESIRNAALQEVVARVLRDGQTARQEIELPRRKRIVAISAVPLPKELGSGVLLVAHDVTDLRRLEKMRREFVSNVSHELKTPLTSIQAYTETLLDGAIDDPNNNRTFLDRILTQAERLQTLILDMLRLARIESEPEAFQIQPVSLEELVEECRKVHAPIADQARVKLAALEIEPDLAVMADRDGVRTILNNLVRNAITYTPAGGQVQISVEIEDHFARLIVEDTGVGISREEQARIFERFYRIDKARSRAAGGTGLGLAIVKHLSQVFHGDVSVESEHGRGSRFTVRLPLAESPISIG
jgi:two-component system phosphate regulon sensor histidine kinase PhoR